MWTQVSTRAHLNEIISSIEFCVESANESFVLVNNEFRMHIERCIDVVTINFRWQTAKEKQYLFTAVDAVLIVSGNQ